MLRQRLTDEMKNAMRSKDEATLSTVRMILSQLKNKDIEARPGGNATGIDDAAILTMLQSMIKQRQESIALYVQGNRPELADKEKAEIAVIERFLPKQMSDADVQAAIAALVTETGASSIKDMGKVMAALKERYAGQLDMGKASAAIKAKLSGG